VLLLLDDSEATCSDGAYAGAAAELDDSAVKRLSQSSTDSLYGSQGSRTVAAAASGSRSGVSVL
jgi:hypothetical protein